MQINVDVTVRCQTKPTLRHQDLKRFPMGSIHKFTHRRKSAAPGGRRFAKPGVLVAVAAQ